MALDFGIFEKGTKIIGESGFFVEVDSAGSINITGSVTFPSAQAVTITSGTVSISGTTDVNIASTTGNLSVDIQNATIAVTSSGTWNINNVSEIILNKERWNQTGSSLVSWWDSSTTDETLFTVTGGKKLYIKTIIIQGASGASDDIIFFDGGSGGTIKFAVEVITTDKFVQYDFIVPLEFSTDVYVLVQGAVTVPIFVSGWEEPE